MPECKLVYERLRPLALHRDDAQPERRVLGNGKAGMSEKQARIETLLDAAFGVLAHDCDPLDQGSIKQRQSLKAKFAKILRRRKSSGTERQ